MGADIHMYLEYSDFNTAGGEPYWKPLGGRTNPGRSYRLFAVLADVRNYDRKQQVAIAPRGIPAGNLAYEAGGDYYLHVTGNPEHAALEGFCSCESAERWVASGSSKPIYNKDGKLTKVTHPDWHSASWMTAEEFAAALASCEEQTGEPVGPGYGALNAALQHLAQTLGPDKARVIFWFDN